MEECRERRNNDSLGHTVLHVWTLFFSLRYGPASLFFPMRENKSLSSPFLNGITSDCSEGFAELKADPYNMSDIKPWMVN